MLGGVLLVIFLLSFPLVIGLSTIVLAGILGESLHRDARARNEASELLELNI